MWCHGSPTIAYILGERYLRTGDEKYLEWATYHFNRMLGSVSASWVTPEAYRIDKQSKQWEPDENRPLAWTQSMTAMALGMLKRCAARKAELALVKPQAPAPANPAPVSAPPVVSK